MGFEFENTYKLQVATQQKTLGILRIEVLNPQEHMNLEIFEALIASSVFEKLPTKTQLLLSSIILVPTKTVST